MPVMDESTKDKTHKIIKSKKWMLRNQSLAAKCSAETDKKGGRGEKLKEVNMLHVAYTSS